MPFSFPVSPSVGDRATQGGRVYVWDGYAWGLATSGQIATVPDGSKGGVVVSNGGQTWTIAAGAVVTADLANLAVTEAKIAAGAVGGDKLALHPFLLMGG